MRASLAKRWIVYVGVLALLAQLAAVAGHMHPRAHHGEGSHAHEPSSHDVHHDGHGADDHAHAGGETDPHGDGEHRTGEACDLCWALTALACLVLIVTSAWPMPWSGARQRPTVVAVRVVRILRRAHRARAPPRAD